MSFFNNYFCENNKATGKLENVNEAVSLCSFNSLFRYIHRLASFGVKIDTLESRSITLLTWGLEK